MPNPDLFSLIDENNINEFKEVAVSGDVDLEEKYAGITPLLYATQLGRFEFAEFLLSNNVDMYSIDDKTGQNAVHLATYNDCDQLVKHFLELGFSLNDTDRKGQMLIHIAAEQGAHKCIRAILEYGTSHNIPTNEIINVKNSNGHTPLQVAALNAQYLAFEVLIDSGGDAFSPLPDGTTIMESLNPLRYQIGYKNIISKIIRSEKIEMTDFSNYPHNIKTPSRQASFRVLSVKPQKTTNNRPSIPQPVYSYEPMPKKINPYLDNPYVPEPSSARRSSTSQANTVEKEPMSIIEIPQYTITPRRAVSNLRKPMRNPIVRADAKIIEDFDIPKVISDKVCYFEEKFKQKIMSSLILSKQMKNAIDQIKDLPDSDCKTLLHHAVTSRKLALLGYLIETGWDMNASDKDGNAPLHLACEKGFDDVVLRLLKSGAEVNAGNGSGETPLLIAASRGSLKCMELLVSYKGNINMATSDGLTLLHVAVAYKQKDVLEWIIRKCNKSFDVDYPDDEGRTALHTATMNRYIDIIRLLVNKLYADVNKEDSYGKKPVDYAKDQRSRAILRVSTRY